MKLSPEVCIGPRNILRMVWVTILIQDPDIVPDHIDWCHGIFSGGEGGVG